MRDRGWAYIGTGTHANACCYLDVFRGHRGQLRKHYQAGQETQVDTLGIMINIIVLWPSVPVGAPPGPVPP